MALAFTIKKRNLSGNQKRNTVDIAFDSSYPTGGESATAANFGLQVVDHVDFPEPTGGYLFLYDRTNSKILAYAQGVTTGSTAAGAMEATGALLVDDKAAETVARIAGTAASTTYTLGAFKEVLDTTDLSALTAVRAIAYGR